MLRTDMLPLLVAIVLLSGSTENVSAFVAPTSSTTVGRIGTTAATTTTVLSAKRRGGLAKNIFLDEEGEVKLLTNKQKQKIGNNERKKGGGKKKKGDAAAISPLLAEWANEEGGASPAADDSESSSSKKKGTKRRGGGMGDRTAAPAPLVDEQNSELVASVLTQVETMLETPNCNIPDLLSTLRSLVDAQDERVVIPSLKGLLSPKSGDVNYRLAWVGGDEAICHVGTGLHKVPLARMQEVFMTLRSTNGRMELMEVIRILGPFPNVRNTLRGAVKVGRGTATEGRQVASIDIRYDSMMDGTGKEILAGTEKNQKDVALDIWFASENALVCSVPDEDGKSDPFGSDGSRVLLFVAEKDLDDALEKLRA